MTTYHVVRLSYSTPAYAWWCNVIGPDDEALLKMADTPPARCACGAGLRYENGEPVQDKEKATA